MLDGTWRFEPGPAPLAGLPEQAREARLQRLGSLQRASHLEHRPSLVQPLAHEVNTDAVSRGGGVWA